MGDGSARADAGPHLPTSSPRPLGEEAMPTHPRDESVPGRLQPLYCLAAAGWLECAPLPQQFGGGGPGG